ncbi:hypothetical protein BDB01DRAFT_837594 [Pilobolus umbonatus]|nr:hypothetical protein BDB01DRAFT_837594 [Pilobolus umbonatus]
MPHETRKTDAHLIRSRGEIRVLVQYRIYEAFIKVKIVFNFIGSLLPIHIANVFNNPMPSASRLYIRAILILKCLMVSIFCITFEILTFSLIQGFKAFTHIHLKKKITGLRYDIIRVFFA